ncbi:MAG: MmcB family DNA repair protein [Alphaproteobacteria bacterium]
MPTRARAPRIVRGVARHFVQLGCAVLAEVPLNNGRRADVLVLDGGGGIAIVEVKSGRADLAADHKWPDYRDFCDRFYFAVDPDFPCALLPAGTGVIIADDYGAEIITAAPAHPLRAARRKAVTLRFAHLAARRLMGIDDPLAQFS